MRKSMTQNVFQKLHFTLAIYLGKPQIYNCGQTFVQACSKNNFCHPRAISSVFMTFVSSEFQWSSSYKRSYWNWKGSWQRNAIPQYQVSLR